jgi:glycosyltransferase involved in cell wall biosynthesis
MRLPWLEWGFVVPPENPDALGESIRRLLGDVELRKQIGEAGRARVEGVYREVSGI